MTCQESALPPIIKFAVYGLHGDRDIVIPTDQRCKILVSINIADVRVKQSVSDYLNHLFPDHNISDTEIGQKTAFFPADERGKVFRGKQEIEFLCKFLTKIKDDLCNNSPKHFDRKRKIAFSVPNLRDILSALSQYATTPECLRLYLKRRHALYFSK